MNSSSRDNNDDSSGSSSDSDDYRDYVYEMTHGVKSVAAAASPSQQPQFAVTERSSSSSTKSKAKAKAKAMSIANTKSKAKAKAKSSASAAKVNKANALQEQIDAVDKKRMALDPATPNYGQQMRALNKQLHALRQEKANALRAAGEMDPLSQALASCASCGVQCDSLCAGCCAVFYCSSECHEADWTAGHHLVCG